MVKFCFLKLAEEECKINDSVSKIDNSGFKIVSFYY